MGAVKRFDLMEGKRAHRFSKCVLAALILACFAPVVSAQEAQAREVDVEKLLAQADAYYQKGDYKLAIGCYLESAAISQSRMNLSRSYFGLSLCYYYLGDTAAVTKYLRKVIEVDPNKEISELFYPSAFVSHFERVRSGVAGGDLAAAEKVVPPKPVPEKAEAERPKTKTEKVAEEIITEEETTKPAARKTKASGTGTAEPPPQDLEITQGVGGHWEINAHYSSWGINLVKTLFEDAIKEKIGEEIQREIVRESGTIQAGLVKLNYSQSLTFDSNGSNYGCELRYYARGLAGTYSFGLALEKTDLQLLLQGTARQEYTNGAAASVDAQAKLVSSPFSVHINFRWEVGVPEAIIRPYFLFGFGFAPLKGTFSYSYTGTFQRGELSQTIGESQEKTFDELSEDIEFNIPKVLVILQLHFGLKAQLYKGIYLLGEAGFWDGFVLRGGLAYRF
jgi:tetratricopeptide (TPR) repeat protein